MNQQSPHPRVGLLAEPRDTGRLAALLHRLGYEPVLLSAAPDGPDPKPLQAVLVTRAELDGEARAFLASLAQAGVAVVPPGGRDTPPLTAENVSRWLQAALPTTPPPAVPRAALDELLHTANGIAHDINNMLTVVTGGCSLLAETEPAGSARELLGDMNEAAQRATHLIRQLMDLCRANVTPAGARGCSGRGQAPPRPEQPRADWNEMIRGMLGLLRRLAGDGVYLETDLTPTPCPVRLTAAQMEQVLLNLVINARDAMPDGGRLTIRTAARDLPHGPHAVLTVADTGHGMDADIAAHIFEPYFTTKPPEVGTGVGLATVHRLVHQAGGAIKVHTRPGAGSTFTLSFPLPARQ